MQIPEGSERFVPHFAMAKLGKFQRFTVRKEDTLALAVTGNKRKYFEK